MVHDERERTERGREMGQTKNKEREGKNLRVGEGGRDDELFGVSLADFEGHIRGRYFPERRKKEKNMRRKKESERWREGKGEGGWSKQKGRTKSWRMYRFCWRIGRTLRG